MWFFSLDFYKKFYLLFGVYFKVLPTEGTASTLLKIWESNVNRLVFNSQLCFLPAFG